MDANNFRIAASKTVSAVSLKQEVSATDAFCLNRTMGEET